MTLFFNILRILRGAGPDGHPASEVRKRMIHDTERFPALIHGLRSRGLVGGTPRASRPDRRDGQEEDTRQEQRTESRQVWHGILRVGGAITGWRLAPYDATPPGLVALGAVERHWGALVQGT